jgi:hypothetical protein
LGLFRGDKRARASFFGGVLGQYRPGRKPFPVSPFLRPKTSWQDPEAVKQLGYGIRTFRDGTYGGLKLVKVGSGREGAIYTVTMS